MGMNFEIAVYFSQQEKNLYIDCTVNGNFVNCFKRGRYLLQIFQPFFFIRETTFIICFPINDILLENG